MKRIKLLLFILTICILSNVVLVSAENKYLIESTKNNIGNFEFNNNQAYITNQITNINENEINLELIINNKKHNEIIKEPGTEIMIVIDNSASMTWLTEDNIVRKTKLLDSVKTLVNKIYEESSDTKVGIVRFAGIWDSDDYDCDDEESYCKDGITGKQSVKQDGAVLMQELTTDSDKVISSIEQFSKLNTIFKEDTELATNIALGVKTAKDNFSSINNTKVILLLTDGCPTQYFNKSVEGGWFATYYQDDANRDTKNYLSSLSSDYNIISLMTGVTDEEDKEHILSIFGTQENPNFGKFYNIQDNDIDTIVENDIFKDLEQYITNPITNINMELFLNEHIKNNFDLIIDETNKFNIEDNIYTINEIKDNDKVNFKYKLVLKNDYSEDIYDKEIPVFNSINIDYNNEEGVSSSVKIDNSPSIRITYIPQTNAESNIFIFSILFIGGIGLMLFCKKFNYFKNI